MLSTINYAESVCKDNLFVNVRVGSNIKSTLDSANWDIQSEGGDRNYYTYDVNKYISKNIRSTINLIDTTFYTSITPDSLVISKRNSKVNGFVKYSGNSRLLKFDYGTGTIWKDSLYISTDSIYYQYTATPVTGVPDTAIYTMKFLGDKYKLTSTYNDAPEDNDILNCTETISMCNCVNINSTTIKYIRADNAGYFSDTLWADGIPKESRHFTISKKSNENQNSNTIYIQTTNKKLNVMSNPLKYDLTGRKIK